MKNYLMILAVLITGLCNNVYANNGSPFALELEETSIPGAPAIHSFSFAQLNGKWLFIGGRTNGLHGFTPATAFPRQFQNKFVYVVDPNTNQVWSRNLFLDLSITAADPLRSTNSQHVQVGNYLYISGGYGIDSSAAGTFVTFATLTRIDIAGIMQAVMTNTSMASSIKQSTDNRVQVTGGEMEFYNGYFYLYGGHKFTGIYFNTGQGTNNQQYTNQMKKFHIVENSGILSIADYTATTDTVNFHRRDLNLVPAIKPDGSEYMINYGGVFQYNKDLPFQNPVYIDQAGYTVDASYEQKINQYTTAHMSLFDSTAGKMMTTFFGGTSLYYYDHPNNLFVKDTLVPFIKDIVLVSRSSGGTSTESVFSLEMPDLLGTNAHFIVNKNLPLYSNDVIKINRMSGRTLTGYIYGGIRASLPNVTPSVANDKIYKVYITPKPIGITPISNIVPSKYSLSQNYPNPFNPSTKIKFDAVSSGKVHLAVYDALGKEVAELVNQELSAGIYEVSFNASDLSGGIYFYRLETGSFIETKKMMLIK